MKISTITNNIIVKLYLVSIYNKKTKFLATKHTIIIMILKKSKYFQYCMHLTFHNRSQYVSASDNIYYEINWL